MVFFMGFLKGWLGYFYWVPMGFQREGYGIAMGLLWDFDGIVYHISRGLL
jgi:hypothetical protein